MLVSQEFAHNYSFNSFYHHIYFEMQVFVEDTQNVFVKNHTHSEQSQWPQVKW